MEEASNFDPNAFWNDGSCVFEAEVAFCWTEGFQIYFNSLGFTSIKMYINNTYYSTQSLQNWCAISPCNVPSDMLYYRPKFYYNLYSSYKDSVTVKATTETDSVLIEKRRVIKPGCNVLRLDGN
jgi:hypothetical protein